MDPQQYNGLISVHAALMIFLFIIPAFAGLANFVIPLMLGAEDMAFPRLNALPWLPPIAGIMMFEPRQPGGAFGAGLDCRLRAAVGGGDRGQRLVQHGRPGAGASSIMTAVNFLVHRWRGAWG